MKKAFPIALMIFGLAFIAGGIYSVDRGADAREQVRAELLAQKITTPGDAAIPNAPVDDARTAEAMAEIIDVHARQATGDLTYAEMGRFMVSSGDPAGTDLEEEAVIGADGRPVANPLRTVAFQASALRSSLYTSVMAFNVADLVTGLGLMMVVLGVAVGGVGVALGGLAIPALARKVHVDPVAAHPV